ncbi:hypothetical protein [Actinoplanes sp. G11-F43]|uniref:hypothetical protein n=1 Tax=Actinoplanes sp. G11-F43 TaxID=3424130 RepID=UPI003D34592D
MTQHDPTSRTGPVPRHAEARWDRTAPGEPARPSEVPDPNSLPSGWSPSGTAHTGSAHIGPAHTDHGVPTASFTPGAPTGFASGAVFPGAPGGAPASRDHHGTGWDDAPAFRDRHGSGWDDGSGSRGRHGSGWDDGSGFQGRYGTGWSEVPAETGSAPDHFDPAASWNDGTTTDRNPWTITPLPDRFPAEWSDTTWNDTAVPGSGPPGWTGAAPPRRTETASPGWTGAAPPAGTGNSTAPEPATGQWGAATGWNTAGAVPAETPAAWDGGEGARAAEPRNSARNAVPGPAPVRSWEEAGNQRSSPRTEIGSFGSDRPGPADAPEVSPAPATHRGPQRTLVIAVIVAALAGGGVGAGIMAAIGGDTAATAPATPAPAEQPAETG